MRRTSSPASRPLQQTLASRAAAPLVDAAAPATAAADGCCAAGLAQLAHDVAAHHLARIAGDGGVAAAPGGAGNTCRRQALPGRVPQDWWS